MKDIKGYEGRYAVTSDGRVCAYPRISGFTRLGKNITKNFSGKWLSNKPRKDGYVIVNLFSEGKPVHKYMHRLVAEAYVPNPDNLPDINHLDCNPANNRKDNLEWCTTSQNIKYGYDTGRHRPIRGEKAWSAKLNSRKVKQIRI